MTAALPDLYRGAHDGRQPLEAGLRAEPSLDACIATSLRRQSMLNGCKWDIQVGDSTTLADFPLVMKRNTWEQLATLAENLAAEARAAEHEIARRPEVLHLLGMPSALRKVLATPAPLTPAAGHVIRFDFHFTTDGWRISEANSDVPGGFSEASHFTSLMSEHFPHLTLAGNPAETWCDALSDVIEQNGHVALLSAPGILSDHQVIAYLASCLEARGLRTHLVKPEQIQWRDGVAQLDTNWHRGPLAAVIRFYQAEWLPRLPVNSGWHYFFRGGKTLVTNPPLGVISESKRFPLTWKHLSTPLPTWRKLLPDTCDPREISWSSADEWLFKTAYCNNGEAVCIRQIMKPRQWWLTKLHARLTPGHWVAQRHFESVPISTPLGLRNVCVGVYTVNGRACGAYARLSATPVVDYAAVDVALLIDPNE